MDFQKNKENIFQPWLGVADSATHPPGQQSRQRPGRSSSVLCAISAHPRPVQRWRRRAGRPSAPVRFPTIPSRTRISRSPCMRKIAGASLREQMLRGVVQAQPLLFRRGLFRGPARAGRTPGSTSRCGWPASPRRTSAKTTPPGRGTCWSSRSTPARSLLSPARVRTAAGRADQA